MKDISFIIWKQEPYSRSPKESIGLQSWNYGARGSRSHGVRNFTRRSYGAGTSCAMPGASSSAIPAIIDVNDLLEKQVPAIIDVEDLLDDAKDEDELRTASTSSYRSPLPRNHGDGSR